MILHRERTKTTYSVQHFRTFYKVIVMEDFKGKITDVTVYNDDGSQLDLKDDVVKANVVALVEKRVRENHLSYAEASMLRQQERFKNELREGDTYYAVEEDKDGKVSISESCYDEESKHTSSIKFVHLEEAIKYCREKKHTPIYIYWFEGKQSFLD